MKKQKCSIVFRKNRLKNSPDNNQMFALPGYFIREFQDRQKILGGENSNKTFSIIANNTQKTKIFYNRSMTPERWAKIKDLFEAALGISPVEYEEFLKKECGDDVELRREVEKLLETYREDETFLEDSVIAEAASMFDKDQTTDKTQNSSYAKEKILDERYQILNLLGKGGMGEVYLAHDSDLRRKVALKILPADFAEDNERMKRFIQEARTVSALNHPNILTIYEIGEAEGVHFIATEYIEGETLKEHLKRKNLTIEAALDIAVQITMALAAAHKAGIIHRDIKPDNVMIRKDGIVKMLDFGLAKTTFANLQGKTSDNVTITEKVMTKPGMIMGTPQYMSPEQARGKKVDSRSDIFSLGVVIYEMITSHPPFEGENSMDIIGSILRDEPPPLRKYFENPPNKLGRTIDKTLHKDPDNRYQNINDLLDDLKELRNNLTFQVESNNETDEAFVRTTFLNTISLVNPKRFSFVHAILATLSIVLVIGISWWWFNNDNANITSTSQQSNFEIKDIINWSSAPGELFNSASFSPDGKMVAFDSTKSGTQSIWVKRTSVGESVQVTKDKFDNKYPLWSPDGEELAFYSRRGKVSGIWRINIFGGSPILITQLKDFGSELRYWSKSGKIYYQSRFNLYAMDVLSGETKQITDIGSKKNPIDIINVSPDETQVAYLINEEKRWNIKITPIVGESIRQIVSVPNKINSLVWHPDGKRILYSELKNGIFQISEVNLESGNSIQLSLAEKDRHVKDVSSDGFRILFGSAREESNIYRVDIQDGNETAVSTEINSELWADVSPDNEVVAFQSIKNLSQGNKLYEGSIVLKSLSENDQTTEITESGFLPQWSPDGKKLAFLKFVGMRAEIWKVNRNGTDPKRLVKNEVPAPHFTVSPYNRWETKVISWSPKNDVIAYSAIKNDISNLWLVSVDGSNDRQITDNDKNWRLFCPIWNSDGTKIAFALNSSKRNSKNERTYQFWLYDIVTNEKQKLLETTEMIRLLGWSPSNNELIYALSKKELNSSTQEVYIHNLSLETGESKLINTFSNAYYFNIHLSPDGKNIGFASRSTKNDEIWYASLNGGQSRKLTKNNDPQKYFSSLSWSPDSKSILFGKQSRYSLLSMLVNLKSTEQKNDEENDN